DDSRTVRMILTKQISEMGFEIDEAEDGEQGLAKLEEIAFDLILLDVTMPVLDGPGMLAKMRANGDKTPVLMLTSESKRSIVAQLMKLGIDDYILKPFKNDELKRKILKSLKMEGQGASAAAVEASREAAAVMAPASAEDGGGRQFVDILLVDDMENVAKKFRAAIPPHLSMHSCVSAQAALNVCRERIFRVVLIDNEIPDVDSSVLMNQLRVLQPHAAFLALALRSVNKVQAEMKELGFDDVLFKPFQPEAIDDLLGRYFDNQELLIKEDNVLKVAAFQGRQEWMEKYYLRVAELLRGGIETVAAACFDDLIVDVSQMPRDPQRTAQLIIEVEGHGKKFGLSLRLVGSPEVGKLLKAFSETSQLPIFNTVEEAAAA
ncbi:MAG TPA: response regulator, partial [Polyangia bacterium]|nr:response regulator [Polyangia bacterium]